MFPVACRNPTKQISEDSNKQSREDKMIKDFLKQNYIDFSNRDWNKFRAYFWENATITTIWKKPGESGPNIHVTTIDEFLKQTFNGPDSKPSFDEKMVSSQITQKGDLATAWTEYTTELGTGDSLERWKGIDLFSLMQFKGSWKIVSLAFKGDR